MSALSALPDIPHVLADYLRAALSSPYTALPSIPKVRNTSMPVVGGANIMNSADAGVDGLVSRLTRRAVHLENLEIVDRAIGARSVVTIIVFFVVNILVIFPLRIPLPLFLPRLFHRFFPSAEPATPAHAPAVGKEEPSGDLASAPSAAEPALEEKARTDTAVTASPGKGAAVEGEQGKGSRDTKSQEVVKRWHFVLGLETAPVIGWLLLLAATCINGEVVRNGIVGGGGVRPYDIMTLFLSFAYIAISLDRTNLLRYLAFHVATRAASSGRKLYVAFFVFFSFTGLIVGNDPLILSGTPFLAHFSRLAGIDNPTAYLFTQFQTANLVSALLVSSNPTNLVLSSGFGLSFLQYSAWLALPTVASILVLFPLLRWVVFRKPGMIPLDLRPPTADPANALKDPWGAAFGGVVFLITIIVLIALSAVGKLEGVEGVWTVTAPAALLILSRDVAYDVVSRGTREGDVRESSRKAGEEKGAATSDEDVPAADRSGSPAAATAVATPAKASTPSASRPASPARRNDGTSTPGDLAITDQSSPMQRQISSRSSDDTASLSPTPRAPTTSAAKPTNTPAQITTHPTGPFRTLRARFPTVTSIVAHLPWTLIPFAFSMFILVESLSHTGWIRVFGGWWAAWADVGGVAGGIFLMGLIGALGCNIFGTNIGCVVLLSRVMQQWAVLRPDVSERTFFGSVFALAIGSNFGAYSFVFPASLAGLLWKHLLAQKDMYISRKEFAYWNTVPVVVTMIVGCLVVAGEVCVMLPG